MWDPHRVTVLFLMVCCSGLDAVGDKYSRTSRYHDEVMVRCSNKNSPLVKILQDYSDVMNYGPQTVDLRIKRKTFSRVQAYFPHCQTIVENLEVAVQAAEAQMFPKKLREQETWMEAVVQSLNKDGGQEQFNQEMRKWNLELQNSKSWFEKYHNYDEIVNWYKNLASNNQKLITYIESIGETKEGRQMPCLHITASKDPNRKRFYIQCQIHASECTQRKFTYDGCQGCGEWISGAVCMYIAKSLVDEYSVKRSVINLLDNLEVVLVPFVNPDGYVYTWTEDRLWRKNRNRHPGSNCVGIDINRNFPDGFKKKKNSCAEDYGGPSAESELETQHIIANFRKNPRIIGSLDLHSYGQLILRPYGKSKQSYPDEAQHARIGKKMAEIIAKEHGSNYTSERSADLYECYGIVADWLYSDDAARTNGGYRSASLCVELRSKSATIGFLLPANEILATAQETYPAFLYYMQEMLHHPIRYHSSSRFSSHVSSDFNGEDGYVDF